MDIKHRLKRLEALYRVEKDREWVLHVCFYMIRNFFLLDEPTSNLDSLNEGIILKSIYEERKDKTIIFVSHRDSTLAHCNRVIHMEFNRVS